MIMAFVRGLPEELDTHLCVQIRAGFLQAAGVAEVPPAPFRHRQPATTLSNHIYEFGLFTVAAYPGRRGRIPLVTIIVLFRDASCGCGLHRVTPSPNSVRTLHTLVYYKNVAACKI